MSAVHPFQTKITMATTHVHTPSQTIIFTTFFLIFTVLAAETTLPRPPLEKLTHIRFYFHNVVQGPNTTVIQVAAPAANNSLTLFGIVYAMDNLLTVGPNASSTELGKARGFFAFESMTEVELWQSMNVVFTSGNYKGSTLTLLGRNNEESSTGREIPVVGGTGVFRLARGFALLSTYSRDPGVVAVVEYNVYVFHYVTAFPVDDESTSSINVS